MVLTDLHWVDGPWPGRLGLAARPRGGDWLGEEMAQWRIAGVDTVVSLLETDEERELGLSSESTEARASGMNFKSLPIADRQVPLSKIDFVRAIEELDGELADGKNLVVHCRQGIGRTGLVSACLFVLKGVEPEIAVKSLSEARGLIVPETAQQRQWINEYAEMFSYKR